MDEALRSSISERLKQLQVDIGKTAHKASRQPDSVSIVLVTKTVPVERIEEAYQAGCRDFGENRIQEFLDKKDKLPPDIRWHFIGRFQTNKVKFWLDYVKLHPGREPLLHSMDRLELAAEIEKQAEKKGIHKVPCLIQINSSGESSKGGFEPENVVPFVRQLTSDSVLDLKGLMTIGPFTDNESSIREAFKKVSSIQSRLKRENPERSWDILSMGMSSDYRIAIEEGATMVRVGSTIFGARKGKTL